MLQKLLEVTPIDPPLAPRPQRMARFAAEGERKMRYTLPAALESASPVGDRTRAPLSADEAAEALQRFEGLQLHASVPAPMRLSTQNGHGDWILCGGFGLRRFVPYRTDMSRRGTTLDVPPEVPGLVCKQVDPAVPSGTSV